MYALVLAVAVLAPPLCTEAPTPLCAPPPVIDCAWQRRGVEPLADAGSVQRDSSNEPASRQTAVAPPSSDTNRHPGAQAFLDSIAGEGGVKGKRLRRILGPVVMGLGVGVAVGGIAILRLPEREYPGADLLGWPVTGTGAVMTGVGALTTAGVFRDRVEVTSAKIAARYGVWPAEQAVRDEASFRAIERWKNSDQTFRIGAVCMYALYSFFSAGLSARSAQGASGSDAALMFLPAALGLAGAVATAVTPSWGEKTYTEYLKYSAHYRDSTGYR